MDDRELDLDALEKVARAADEGMWLRRGLDVEQSDRGQVAFCEAVEGAEHIATFDPPTVLKLISTLRAQQAKITEQDAEIERLEAIDQGANAVLFQSNLKLAERVRVLEGLLNGVLAITRDSTGVAGYHLNGNVAEWDEFPEIEAVRQALSESPNEK